MGPYTYKNALLVDDNHIDNLISKKILESNQVAEKIITAISGREAMEYVIKYANNSDMFPDIIFLDIRMPEMDGFEFLEEFEKLNTPLKYQTKICMLSSSLDPVDQKKVVANKFVVKFIGKPLSVEHLKGIV